MGRPGATGRLTGLLVLALLLAVGCGGEEREVRAGNPCIAGFNADRDDPPPDADALERACRERTRPEKLPDPGGEDARVTRGRRVVTLAGCLACHRIGATGNDGPGPDLSDIGDRLLPGALRRTLLHPVAPMPSFASLPRKDLRALVAYLATLR